MRVCWTTDGADDLEVICDYIATDSRERRSFRPPAPLGHARAMLVDLLRTR
jgi:hypothetical protein